MNLQKTIIFNALKTKFKKLFNADEILKCSFFYILETGEVILNVTGKKGNEVKEIRHLTTAKELGADLTDGVLKIVEKKFKFDKLNFLKLIFDFEKDESFAECFYILNDREQKGRFEFI